MISKDKQYRTRDGREVRIYATDGVGDQSVHGAVFDGSTWLIYAWYDDGQYARSDKCGRHDLIEVKPRIKRTVWLNVYEHNIYCEDYKTKEKADDNAMSKRLACVKVEIDVEEGEGL
jgi:hypothetical protein